MDSKVQVAGYPRDKDYASLWLSQGKVVMLEGDFIGFDAYITSGNSGSPLLNEDRQLIGLANASTDSKEGSPDAMSFGFLFNPNQLKLIEEHRMK